MDQYQYNDIESGYSKNNNDNDNEINEINRIIKKKEREEEYQKKRFEALVRPKKSKYTGKEISLSESIYNNPIVYPSNLKNIDVNIDFSSKQGLIHRSPTSSPINIHSDKTIDKNVFIPIISTEMNNDVEEKENKKSICPNCSVSGGKMKTIKNKKSGKKMSDKKISRRHKLKKNRKSVKKSIKKYLKHNNNRKRKTIKNKKGGMNQEDKELLESYYPKKYDDEIKNKEIIENIFPDENVANQKIMSNALNNTYDDDDDYDDDNDDEYEDTQLNEEEKKQIIEMINKNMSEFFDNQK